MILGLDKMCYQACNQGVKIYIITSKVPARWTKKLAHEKCSNTLRLVVVDH